MVEIVQITDCETKQRIARSVLEALPEWFGIEEDLKSLKFFPSFGTNVIPVKSTF